MALLLSVVAIIGYLFVSAPAVAKEVVADSASDWHRADTERLRLHSKAALIVDHSGDRLYAKSPDVPRPIASLTKLMTAMVLLDAHLDMNQHLTITQADRDRVRLTGSRLHYGARLSRRQLLALALMSSENRAAHALARTYPGGVAAFVRAMNAKARQLHMSHSHFVDPVGLHDANQASPADLVRMIKAAAHYPLIRQLTTRRMMNVHPYSRLGPLHFVNTNRLLHNRRWTIELSKTGYINEAGHCLAMLVNLDGDQMVMVFLDAYGKLTPFGDANRTANWLRKGG